MSNTRRSQSAGRAIWIWLAASLGGAGVALIAVFAVAVAVLGASLQGCQPSSEPAPQVSGPAPSAYALQTIAPERLRLYEAAGRRFDIDWSFLASIAAQECGSGDCAGTNSAGCAGPMQIAYVRESECSKGPGPTLWETYAVNADPGHPLSINDPADAIFTAARILREDKGAPPTGGTFAEYHQAACNYYGACADATVSYAEEVMARAVQYGFTGAGAPRASSPTLAEPVSGGCNASTAPPSPASSSRIVRIAESQLGQGEHPSGSNCTIYSSRCEPWCSLFASWVWTRAGVPLAGQTAAYGYSGSLYTWTKEHAGKILPPTATPAPGDLVFYGTGPGESKHVGIVQKVYPDGQITTIDGNYANQVSLVGPFQPSQATVEGEHIYGYAQPPTTGGRR